MKNLLRTWVPILVCFGVGWAAEGYWYHVHHPAPSSAKPHGPTQYVNKSNGSPFSANHANAVTGHDANPQLVPWSAASALGKILAATRGGERTLAIAGLVDQTPTDQLGALIDQARFCTDGEARDDLLNMAYAKWATADPQSALTFARTAATKRFDKDSGPLNQVLATWAGADPQAALAAAQNIDLLSFRQEGIRSVLGAMAEGSNPQDALTIAKGMNLGAQLSPALESIYNGWAERDPAAAFAALDQVDNQNMRNTLAGNILQTMAEQDPQGALDLLKSMPEGAQFTPPYPLNPIFSRLTMQDPQAALSALAEVPAGAMHQQAVTCIACDWADSDPQGALSWANSLSNPADRDIALYNAVRHMSGSDPAAAASALKDIPDFNQRNNAMNDIINHWSDSNPTAALQWVQNNTSGNAQASAIGQIVNNVASTDPLAALAIAQQNAGSPNYNGMINQTLNNWSSSDPNAAMAWATNNLSGIAQTSATNVIARQLISADPTAGGDYVAQMPAGPNRDNLMSQVASSMSQVDYSTALAWVGNVGGVSDNVRDNATQTVMNNWAQIDPAAAAAKLQTLNIDTTTAAGANSMAQMAGRIASDWAQSDPASALAYAESLGNNAAPTGASQTGLATVALGNVLNTVASADPVSAWNDVLSLPNDGSIDIGQLMGGVVSAWSQSDPATAAGLIDSLPDNQLNKAVTTISNNWIRQDPQAASQWIDTLPTGATRDVAVNNLINLQGGYDLSAGMSWAATMSTEAGQTKAYTSLISQWARKDPAAALAAVNTAPMTDAQRASLTIVIQKSPPPNLQFQNNNNYHYETINGKQVLIQN